MYAHFSTFLCHDWSTQPIQWSKKEKEGTRLLKVATDGSKWVELGHGFFPMNINHVGKRTLIVTVHPLLLVLISAMLSIGLACQDMLVRKQQGLALCGRNSTGSLNRVTHL